MVKNSALILGELLDITLELTRSCSLNCLICSSNGGQPHPNEMSVDKWIQTIDEALLLGANSFSISGGEPYNYPGLSKILDHLNDKNAKISIYTSGNIKNESLAQLSSKELKPIKKYKNAKIIFNLQGSDKKTHDKMTQVKGSYNNTLSSIKTTIGLEINTEIHFVPTSINFKELTNIVQLSKNLDIQKVSVLRFVPQGRGKKNRHRLELKQDEQREFNNILKELHTDQIIRIGSPFSPTGYSTNTCACGINRITIRYDGKVFPCEAMKFLENKYIGNDINNNSLSFIYHNSSLFSEVRQFKNLILKSECINCDEFSTCKGGCYAQKLVSFENRICNIDPMCDKMKVELK